MAYARRGLTVRSATVTAVEPSWALALRVADIDAVSAPCRARFTEAFLAIMADRISMLGGRLLSVLQEQKIGLV
jgi:CRP-like cAMP-binding protein